jgi:hypothetical protein
LATSTLIPSFTTQIFTTSTPTSFVQSTSAGLTSVSTVAHVSSLSVPPIMTQTFKISTINVDGKTSVITIRNEASITLVSNTTVYDSRAAYVTVSNYNAYSLVVGRPASTLDVHVSNRILIDTQSIPFIIGILFAAIGALVLILMGIAIYRYCKRSKTSVSTTNVLLKVDNSSNLSTTVSSSGSTKVQDPMMFFNHKSGTGNSTTYIDTSPEIAVPAYLQMTKNIDFRIGERLGQGGGGAVYLGNILNPIFSRNSHEQVVVKVVFENSRLSLEQQQLSFLQEVAIMQCFRSDPNFSSLLGYCEEPKCLIMKHYEHGSLDKLIYSKSFHIDLNTVLYFFRVIGKSVQKLHNAGIVHRDIKPSNFLLNYIDGKLSPVITDFGVSAIIDETSMGVKAFRTVELKAWSVRYAAPELFQEGNRRMSAVPRLKAADIYSLGIMIAEMMTRQLPYKQSK